MSRGASHYPLVHFISRLMQEAGLSRTEFVRAIGYRDADKGLRRLNLWLDNCDGHELILKQSAAWSGLADELQRAVAATDVVKSAESATAFLEFCKTQQDTFRPYLHVEGETTRPTSITMFAVSGGCSNLKDIPQVVEALPLANQLAALPELMRAYLQEYKGACPLFGKVTGFRYVRCLDYFQFDKDCQLVGQVEEPFRRGTAEVSIR